MSRRYSLLLVTDLGYQAQGRRYCDEDIDLSTRLRTRFDVALCHPRDAVQLMDGFDLVLVRNSGPVIHYPREYKGLREHAASTGARIFNDLNGKADMVGKDYLLDLYRSGYPVIPTVDRVEALDELPAVDTYVVKPKFGADSVGLRMLSADETRGIDEQDVLVQPRIDFDHEVSFYFVNRTFQYAMYAPDPSARWTLAEFEPSEGDLAFAQRFVDWNGITHGIQRVDACRTTDGELLLVEVEDLNPYLSLADVSDERREAFVVALLDALYELAEASPTSA